MFIQCNFSGIMSHDIYPSWNAENKKGLESSITTSSSWSSLVRDVKNVYDVSIKLLDSLVHPNKYYAIDDIIVLNSSHYVFLCAEILFYLIYFFLLVNLKCLVLSNWYRSVENCSSTCSLSIVFCMHTQSAWLKNYFLVMSHTPCKLSCLTLKFDRVEQKKIKKLIK
jgi:hypothetical protein